MSISEAFSQQLWNFYHDCRAHFGHLSDWWPGDPWEKMLSAILVQQCTWNLTWQSILNLKSAGILQMDRLSTASEEDVFSCLKSLSFGPTKTKRIIRFAEWFVSRDFHSLIDFFTSAETDSLREQLLTLSGIGPETADSMLLFASDQHPSFVIDAYTRRVFHRLGFPTPKTDRKQNSKKEFWLSAAYSSVKEFIELHLAQDWESYQLGEIDQGVSPLTLLYRDFHAQILELGKHHCLKANPRCFSQGASGWSNESFCDDHCSEDNCNCCPAAAYCKHAMSK